MLHEKLINSRKKKGLTQQQMAVKIAMEQTTYSKKERGISPINDEEWNRFAKALDIPVDEIKEVSTPLSIKNQNFTFNDNAINAHNNINIPQNIFDIIIKYNAKLEEENIFLKSQIQTLKQENQTLKNNGHK